MKKIVSLFMAVIMLFSISVPSFAALAADTAKLAAASDADAVSSTDGVISDAFEEVGNFFKKAIDAIVDFFKSLFGAESDAAKYKIVFNTDGGSKMSPMVVEEGTTIPSPAIPLKTGYTFIGWSPALPEIMPSYDLEVKALWSINQYTITYDLNKGLEYEPVVDSYIYGSKVEAPANPARNGYDFMGWAVYDSEKKAWVSAEIPEYMPAYNITYKAVWSVKA